MGARRDKLMGKTARRWTLWVHVLCSSLWLGSAVAMVLLWFVKARGVDSAAELYAFCLCAKLIDDYVIIASCGLAALSGMLLSWKTPWGFFRYWWVAMKFVVTVVLLTSGASLLGPWINETEQLARTGGLELLELPRYAALERRVAWLGSTQILVLAFIMHVSIFKPWGKIQARKDVS